jgi:UDP-N-acetylmuramate dehydrogenase
VQSLSSLRDTIISIRESKLPDPEKTGNAGSFFKNPVVSRNTFEALARSYENVPNYPEGDSRVKIPAAWLIQQSGWKGVRKGEVGTWPDQPLVIVNYGNASGEEIFHFSEQIRDSVSEKFGINLEREVTVL